MAASALAAAAAGETTTQQQLAAEEQEEADRERRLSEAVRASLPAAIGIVDAGEGSAHDAAPAWRDAVRCYSVLAL